jgi:hypothetical protein
MPLSFRTLIRARGEDDEAAGLDDLARRHGEAARPVGLREQFAALPEDPPELSVSAWANWLGDHAVSTFTVRPTQRAQVIGALQEAVRRGVRIRAVGSGHSHSNAACPGADVRDIRVDLSALQGKLAHEGWIRPGVDAEHLIRVRAGTTIKKLNRSILPDARRALMNMGSFDGQTVAGAVNTGTHGTGLLLATMADFVRSVELVTLLATDTGRHVVQPLRLEPEHGITDPVRFERDFGRHGMVLLQDTDLFRSVVVGYGCMGIAVAYTLEVRDEYWLEESSELTDLEGLERRLAGPKMRIEGDVDVPEFLLDHRHVGVLVNIAERQADPPVDNVTCLIKRHAETGAESKPDSWRPDWPPERRRTTVRDIVRAIIGGHPAPDSHRPGIGNKLKNYYFEPEANRPPFVKRRTASASYIALRRLRNTTGPDEAPEPPDRAISTEFAVPVNSTAETVGRVLEFIGQSDSLFATPMGIRFTGPSAHYLDASQGRFTAMIEVPILIEAGREAEVERRMVLAKRELAAMERALIDEGRIPVRPHLGKYTEMNRSDLEAAFPRLDKWLAAYRRFNALGVFDNNFTDQFSLSR